MENLGKFEKEPQNEPESFSDSDVPAHDSELGDYLNKLRLQEELDKAISIYKLAQEGKE